MRVMFKKILVSLWIILLSQAASSSAAAELPNMGSATAGITLEQERSLGNAWLRNIRGKANLWDNNYANDYLAEQLSLIAQYTDTPLGPLSTVIIDSPYLNAFAVPGGIIGINSGLFLNANNEAEFSSVLAHEIGHLYQRHYSRMQNNNKNTNKVQLAAFIAAIVLAQQNSEAAQATLFASMANSVNKSLAFSREMETEADRIGLNLLQKAGYSSEAMADLMETLMKDSSFYNRGALEYLQTHPLSKNRIADAKHYSQNHTSNSKIDSGEYEFIRSLSMIHHTAEEERENLITQLSGNADTNYFYAKLTACAFWYLDQGNSTKAAELLTKLTEHHSQFYFVRILSIKLLTQNGQLGEARDAINQLRQDYPNRLAPQFQAANIYLKQNDTIGALEILKNITLLHPDNPRGWEKRLLIEKQAGDAWGELRANTEYLWLIGQEQRAINYLEAAQKESQWTGQQKSRISARLQQMQYDIQQYQF
ncbi:M48 family metalloprotease [Gynuella sp.]|uniref:M48 family metalloprotease n=1 Tax=Gynuella sp. TaxID=2969146 RepID=UPI003D0A76FE